MRVKISYCDRTSLTVEEIVKQAKHEYGPGVSIEVTPESNNAIDILYFAIQQLISHEQISLLYDSSSYQHDLKKLRSDTLFKIEEVLNDVIIDNEARAT